MKKILASLITLILFISCNKGYSNNNYEINNNVKAIFIVDKIFDFLYSDDDKLKKITRDLNIAYIICNSEIDTTLSDEISKYIDGNKDKKIILTPYLHSLYSYRDNDEVYIIAPLNYSNIVIDNQKKPIRNSITEPIGNKIDEILQQNETGYITIFYQSANLVSGLKKRFENISRVVFEHSVALSYESLISRLSYQHNLLIINLAGYRANDIDKFLLKYELNTNYYFSEVMGDYTNNNYLIDIDIGDMLQQIFNKNIENTNVLLIRQ